VPLMLRLVRRGTHRGKLTSARFMLRLLGGRLGRVRLLLDAWFMRARLIEPAVAGGHTVIGRVRRDLALYEVPRPPRQRRRGRPRKYRLRLTPPRIEALPVHRTARILYGKLEVAQYRTCRVAARFLKGRVVRAVWVRRERPERCGGPDEERLLLCTDPDLPATEGHHELRQEVERRTAVRGHEARLGAQGRLAAVAPGADALGDDPNGGLRAQPDAGLHRPGPCPGPRRSSALAATRSAHRRADPGGLGAAFTRGRPARAHVHDLAKIRPANRSTHRETGVRQHQSRLNRQSDRHHADPAAAVCCRGQVRPPVNSSIW
jgi:hypothetical protein